MTGFEPRTSGVASDHSSNWTTATALILFILRSWIANKLGKFPGTWTQSVSVLRHSLFHRAAQCDQVLATNFLTKVAQIFAGFKDYFEKRLTKTAAANFWATFG